MFRGGHEAGSPFYADASFFPRYPGISAGTAPCSKEVDTQGNAWGELWVSGAGNGGGGGVFPAGRRGRRELEGPQNLIHRIPIRAKKLTGGYLGIYKQLLKPLVKIAQ